MSGQFCHHSYGRPGRLGRASCPAQPPSPLLYAHCQLVLPIRRPLRPMAAAGGQPPAGHLPNQLHRHTRPSLLQLGYRSLYFLADFLLLLALLTFAWAYMLSANSYILLEPASPGGCKLVVNGTNPFLKKVRKALNDTINTANEVRSNSKADVQTLNAAAQALSDAMSQVNAATRSLAEKRTNRFQTFYDISLMAIKVTMRPGLHQDRLRRQTMPQRHNITSRCLHPQQHRMLYPITFRALRLFYISSTPVNTPRIGRNGIIYVPPGGHICFSCCQPFQKNLL